MRYWLDAFRSDGDCARAPVVCSSRALAAEPGNAAVSPLTVTPPPCSCPSTRVHGETRGCVPDRACARPCTRAGVRACEALGKRGGLLALESSFGTGDGATVAWSMREQVAQQRHTQRYEPSPASPVSTLLENWAESRPQQAGQAHARVVSSPRQSRGQQCRRLSSSRPLGVHLNALGASRGAERSSTRYGLGLEGHGRGH